ncbi:hypothetical protein OC835_006454 [Tilletia horrida]|nr:hypothetical protein OC835_006454 [Tilletia horrida]
MSLQAGTSLYASALALKSAPADPLARLCKQYAPTEDPTLPAVRVKVAALASATLKGTGSQYSSEQQAERGRRSAAVRRTQRGAVAAHLTLRQVSVGKDGTFRLAIASATVSVQF